MNAKIILLYAAPLTLLFHTAPACFATDTVSSNSNKIDIEQQREKYLRQEQNDLDKAMTDTDNLVEIVDQKADKDVASVPNILYNSPELSAKNADYNSMVDAIRLRERAEIKDIYDKSLEQQATIKQTYEQKISNLEHPQISELKGTELKLASAKHTL